MHNYKGILCPEAVLTKHILNHSSLFSDAMAAIPVHIVNTYWIPLRKYRPQGFQTLVECIQRSQRHLHHLRIISLVS